MANVVVLKIEKDGSVKAFPTEFTNDLEAMQSIKDSGQYIFAEVHDVVRAVKAPAAKKTGGKK